MPENGKGNEMRRSRVVRLAMRRCDLRNLQLVTYENGIGLQSKLVEMRQQEQVPDQILLLEHPPVITLGRGGEKGKPPAPPPAPAPGGVRFFGTTPRGGNTHPRPRTPGGRPVI